MAIEICDNVNAKPSYAVLDAFVAAIADSRDEEPDDVSVGETISTTRSSFDSFVANSNRKTGVWEESSEPQIGTLVTGERFVYFDRVQAVKGMPRVSMACADLGMATIVWQY